MGNDAHGQDEAGARKYRVVLPVEIAGVVYQYGETVELTDEAAAPYAHALIAVEEEQ